MATSPAVDNHTISLVTLDVQTGQMTGVRDRMRASGFDVGVTVAAKKHPSLGSAVSETRVATSLQIFKIVQIVEEDEGEYVSLEKLPAGPQFRQRLSKSTSFWNCGCRLI